MNQSSISVSDVGKSNALLQTGSSESKPATSSEESRSFLSALGAIFQSDSESTEETKATSGEVSEAELKAQSVDELIESEGNALTDDENAEGSTAKEVSASNNESEKALLDSDSGSAEKLPAQDKAEKTMSEGNELLGRLDESSQALTNKDGKSLPQEESESTDAINKLKNDPAISRFIESTDKNEKSEETAATDPTLITKSSALVSEETDDAKPTVVMDKNGNELAATQSEHLKNDIQHEHAAQEEVQLSAQGENVKQEQVSERALVAKSVAEGVDDQILSDQHGLNELQIQAAQASTLEQESTPMPIDAGEELVWNSQQILQQEATNTEQVQAFASVDNGIPKNAVAQGMSTAALLKAQKGDDASLEAVIAELNLNGVSLEELTPEERDYLVQLSNANALSEQFKSTADIAKPATVMTGQQLQAQLQAQHQLQQQAVQSQYVDKAALTAQNTMSAAELNAAQLNLAQSFTPAQAMVVNNANAQQQMTKGATLATGAAAGALVAGDKGETKESTLSQQLSGLAAQQGVAQTAQRADIQQAIQQSPLQLSREMAGEKLSEQVQMMMSKNLKNIDIRLDPPELGRMQIRMSMSGDTAAVQFTVANQQAREMVEQAMPRLREMLAQQGLQLSDSSVHQQSAGQQQGQYASGEANSGSGMQGLSADGELNVDESINLDVNIKSKDDGISFYA